MQKLKRANQSSFGQKSFGPKKFGRSSASPEKRSFGAPSSAGRGNTSPERRSFGSSSSAGRSNTSPEKRSYGSGPSSFINRPPRRNSGPSRNRRTFRQDKIAIHQLIKKASDVQTEVKVDIKNLFTDFDLCPELQANLKKRNYNMPTPIQDQSINHILEGRDLIGLANTGTGKTAAFLLPLINKVKLDRSQKILIVAPTRELAQQIEEEFRQFSWSMGIFSAICVGGAPIYKQITNLRRNPNFVIGTPGRLKDLVERRLIKFEQFGNIVLDEVDRMLDMGFVDEIKDILNVLPKDRQTLFFSATMPDKIRTLVNQFVTNPVTIEVKTGNTTENVDQDVVRVRDKAIKFFQLKELLAQPEFKKVLVFSETKMEVERLKENLSSEGFRAESIHGDKKQHQRQRALESFKRNHINILVATDVAARGLDIKDITHVINYTMPQTYDDYVHRIGRTGRNGSKGFALTFVE